MKKEETVDFPIRWAWHRIARLYNAEAVKQDSTMSIGYALLNIEEEGTPSTKLGPKMGMEARSLTRTLKTMEEKGLIFKQTDSKDGRMVRIFLTEYGREKRDISKNVVLKFNEYIYSKISTKKLNSFFTVMNQINELLENQDILSNEKNDK